MHLMYTPIYFSNKQLVISTDPILMLTEGQIHRGSCAVVCFTAGWHMVYLVFTKFKSTPTFVLYKTIPPTGHYITHKKHTKTKKGKWTAFNK